MPNTTTKEEEVQFRLRPEANSGQCPVAGCDEFPSRLLSQQTQIDHILWCQTHAQMLERVIAKRDYHDFVSALHEKGIKEEPKLVTAEVVGDERKCCVPGCDGAFSCGLNFEPYKNPGRAFVCAGHAYAVNHAVGRLNGPRLLHELRQKRRFQDPNKVKRRTAIRTASTAHQGTRQYVLAVCRDLQRDHIPMLQKWLDGWRVAGFRVEPCNWVDAYRNEIAKPKIQKYIAKVGKIETNRKASHA
jgi:hypothetical protein